MSARTRTIPLAAVKIGTRYRKEMGDLAALAESIAAEGLLAPIALTEANELVAGERRLRACESLGWTEIPYHVVSVSSIMAGEYAENIVRKDFTASERLSLADAIKSAIGDRQGQRTDVGAKKSQLVENSPQVSRGTKTREVVAQLAGFGNETSMREARDVVEQGAPELVAAMDAGALPISVAHELLVLTPEKQAEVVGDGRVRIQEVARELRRDKAAKRDALVPRTRLRQIIEGTYPCTFPGCARDAEDPFDNPGRLANHRFASHQIRSTNVESMERQARRDRYRAELDIQKQQEAGTYKPRPGALDRGERELLRKRTLLTVQQFASEVKRQPSEVVAALLEILSGDLTKPLTAARLAPIDADRSFATGKR